MIKIKNTVNRDEECLDELISKLNTGKQRINKLEDRSIKITQNEMQKEKNKRKTEQTIQEM